MPLNALTKARCAQSPAAWEELKVCAVHRIQHLMVKAGCYKTGTVVITERGS